MGVRDEIGVTEGVSDRVGVLLGVAPVDSDEVGDTECVGVLLGDVVVLCDAPVLKDAVGVTLSVLEGDAPKGNDGEGEIVGESDGCDLATGTSNANSSAESIH